MLRAEGAEALWSDGADRRARPARTATPAGRQTAMRGVAPRYPRYVPRRARDGHRGFPVRARLGDDGSALAVESADNVDLTMLIKMASNGMPVAVDTRSPEARAALARGKAHRSTGAWASATTRAPTATPRRTRRRQVPRRAAAGRCTTGLTRHFPTWRTSQNDAWDMRQRMQWCMTPLGTNMLAADPIEYAELELYLAQFDIGKPLSVPGSAIG